jgi:hypothetical protein
MNIISKASRALFALGVATGVLALSAVAQPHVIKPNVNVQIIRPATPILPVLEVPVASGGFATHLPVATGQYQVLPLFGSAPRMRVWLSAAGSQLHVRATPAGGTTVTIPEAPNGTTPSLPGFFQVLSVDRTKTPAQWHVNIQLPSTTFQGVRDFTVAITSSLPQPKNVLTAGAGVESLPLNFRLFAVTNYNLTVTVMGNGTVIGTGGINCSSGATGVCSKGYSPGVTSLAPVTVTLRATAGGSISFQSWSGLCSGTSPICTVTLDGTAAGAVTAMFQDSGAATTLCPAPPATVAVGGRTLSYADMPECSPSVGASTPALCDAQGYFCCETQTGATSARCGGQDRHEFPPDCHQNLNYSIQSGGCYQ